MNILGISAYYHDSAAAILVAAGFAVALGRSDDPSSAEQAIAAVDDDPDADNDSCQRDGQQGDGRAGPQTLHDLLLIALLASRAPALDGGVEDADRGGPDVGADAVVRGDARDPGQGREDNLHIHIPRRRGHAAAVRAAT